jgi:hypothetical protein
VPPTFTTGQVCKHFDMAVWQLLQTIRRRFLAEPPRVGIYRVWLESDLPRVEAALRKADYLPEGVASA